MLPLTLPLLAEPNRRSIQDEFDQDTRDLQRAPVSFIAFEISRIVGTLTHSVSIPHEEWDEYEAELLDWVV
jgi:hypothetical protein